MKKVFEDRFGITERLLMEEVDGKLEKKIVRENICK